MGFTPGAAAAAHPQETPQASLTHTAATPPAAGLNREVFGFALASSLSDPTYGYPSWNFNLLTTVAFFGLHVQDDGSWAADSGAAVWNSSQLTNLVTTAHSHGTKVVLTIIEQDFSAGTPHMCAALAHATTTITNTVNEVKAKGVDGVNVDYEGLNGSCGSTDSSFARHTYTYLVARLRAALPATAYVSVDTYASSAVDTLGFFDVAGLAQYVDSLFVMAYDLEYSNYGRPPTSCGGFCLGPTAPMGTYYYNDSVTARQYLAVIPAAKVILGVPYYGRKACVGAATANRTPLGAVTADSYLDASQESTSPDVLAGSYVTHRDANDPSGQERWDTWYNTSLKCWRELYWDDALSLGYKDDLVNADNLRGVGIWNLNYGGGSPELWNLLAAKFTTTTPWRSLGGMATSGPGSSAWSAARADVFVRGAGNGLFQNTWNGTSWVGWSGVGGTLTSDPGAISWSPSRIDVFARGTDNSLYHRFGDGTHWSAWESLGGALSAGPDASSWSAGRLDVFVRGSNNALFHKWWAGGQWSSWEDLGGTLASGPAAVSWGANRIDVFARGINSELFHKWWTGTQWSAWEGLGGSLASAPDVSSCASGHLDVFVLGSDHAMYQLGYNGNWGAWQRLGGYWTSDPSAVCPPGTTAVDLFARGTDGALWQTSVPGS